MPPIVMYQQGSNSSWPFLPTKLRPRRDLMVLANTTIATSSFSGGRRPASLFAMCAFEKLQHEVAVIAYPDTSGVTCVMKRRFFQ